MIVDVVRCQKSGDNLVDILKQPVTADEVRRCLSVICDAVILR